MKIEFPEEKRWGELLSQLRDKPERAGERGMETTPNSGGIIKEIGWKCKVVGQGGHGAVSVCLFVRTSG